MQPAPSPPLACGPVGDGSSNVDITCIDASDIYAGGKQGSDISKRMSDLHMPAKSKSMPPLD